MLCVVALGRVLFSQKFSFETMTIYRKRPPIFEEKNKTPKYFFFLQADRRHCLQKNTAKTDLFGCSRISKLLRLAN